MHDTINQFHSRWEAADMVLVLSYTNQNYPHVSWRSSHVPHGMEAGGGGVLNAAPPYSSRWLFVDCCRLDVGLQQPICHVLFLLRLSNSTCCQKDLESRETFIQCASV